jgi:hypothetical protein
MAKTYRPYVPEQDLLLPPSLREWLPEDHLGVLRERPDRSIGSVGKLHAKAGAAVYAARKGIVEPVIGQIKQARGFRQFLLRGFEKVQGEWSLVCTTHNILKLYRLCM